MRIRDVELDVVDVGRGEPPLLLVHGFTGAAVDWADVQPQLAAHRRVVAYTHRGHAGSTATGDPASYTFDQLVADLDALIDALGLAPLHLLGHSMGGVVALRYALDHPDRLRSLVLMDTFAEPMGGGGANDWMGAMLAKVRAEGMEAMLDVMRGFADGALAGVDPARKAELVARVEHKIRHMDPEAFCSFAGDLRTYPSMVDRLGELTMPVTVLRGADDAPFVEPSALMVDRIPGAELAVIDGAGHSPQEDQPEAWLAALEKHLAR
jgi:pimeloyl-ACP methyl ester carboxylesterase